MRRLRLVTVLFLAVACRTSASREAPSSVAVPPPPVPSQPVSTTSPRPASAPSPALPPPSSTPKAAPVAPSRVFAVAALGDSLTDTRVGGGGYLKALARRCPESRFVSFGKGGDMVNQMRRRYVGEIFGGAASGSGGFTHLLVFGGVNDLYSDVSAGRTVEKIESDLTAIYQDARGRGLEVVAVTVAPWGGFTRYFNAARAASTATLNAWILAQRGTLAAFVVDAFPLLSCGDPNFLCPDYAKPHRDGLHFGPGGHEKLAEALYREVFAGCR